MIIISSLTRLFLSILMIFFKSHSPLPLLPAAPTEMSAIYALLVTVKSMLTHLGQHHHVITLDEKIYAPAKEIQWTNYYELKDMVIRLGVFHRAKNLMGIIGE